MISRPVYIDRPKLKSNIVVFHGLGQTATFIRDASQLTELMVPDGHILIYPQAKQRFWRYWDTIQCKVFNLFGLDCQNSDIKFLLDIIDDSPLFLAGFSAGATFAQYAAQHLADQRDLRGLICYAGGNPDAWIETKNKYPLLAINNQNDPLVGPEVLDNLAKKYHEEGHETHRVTVSLKSFLDNHCWNISASNHIKGFIDSNLNKRQFSDKKISSIVLRAK